MDNRDRTFFGGRLCLRWHGDVCSGVGRITSTPQAGDSLLLCVELEARPAVECVGTPSSDRFLVSCEAEHWKGNWKRDIDPHLARLNLLLESARCSARRCEYGHTIAIFIPIDQINSVVQCRAVETHKHWSKYLLLVACHFWRHICDYRRANLLVEGVSAERSTSCVLLGVGSDLQSCPQGILPV